MADLIDVQDLSIEFDNRGTMMPALNRISFRIRPGSTVALVGESGSGKSVTAQAMMGILPKTARITSGNILFAAPGSKKPPRDIVKLKPDGIALRRIRGRHISMIFQEPMVSLSPLHTIGDQVSEPLFLHHRVGHKEGMARTEDMLRLVGFPNPARALKSYPFELSGGLRQRAMIAMALVCRPSLLIADEPTTALDVTIQAQILALVKELQAELGHGGAHHHARSRRRRQSRGGSRRPLRRARDGAGSHRGAVRAAGPSVSAARCCMPSRTST